MKIGFWGIVCVVLLSLGGALDIGKALSVLFRATIGAVNGATSSVVGDQEQPNIIINVPQSQGDAPASRGYNP